MSTRYVAPPFQIPESLVSDMIKLAPLLDVGAQTVQLGIELKEEHLVRRRVDSDYRLVSLVFFAKAFKTFQTVQNLCRCGCGADALSLCASLFENFVDLAYISKAPIRRSRRYTQYEQVDKYFQAQKVLRRVRLPRGVRSKYRGYLKRLDPQVSKILKYFSRQSAGWSGRSLAQRAKAIKADFEYDQLYWIFCGVKHTFPMGAIASIIDEKDGPDLIFGPSIKTVYHAAFYSTVYTLRICKLFADAFKIHVDQKIRKWDQKLSRAAIKIEKSYPALVE